MYTQQLSQETGTTPLYLEPTDWLPIPPIEGFIPPARELVHGGVDYTEKLDKALGGDWTQFNKEGRIKALAEEAWRNHHDYHSMPWQLGQLLTEYVGTANALPVEYSITEKLDWPMASYGASWSCFWKENRRMRAYLVSLGTHGLLLRNNKGKGVARAFLIPHEETVIVSNARGYKVDRLALLTATHFNYAGPISDVVVRIHAEMPDHVPDTSFYSDKTDRLLGTQSSMPIKVAACQCGAKFDSNMKWEWRAVCMNCPFDRTKPYNSCIDE